MESDLSKMDIIHLIRGTEIPDYKTMFEIKNMGLGDYIGGFVDSFEWNNTNSESWDKYSEEELLKLYKELTKKNKVMKSYTDLEQHKSIKEALDNAFCKFVTESLHRNDEMIKKYSK